MIKKNSNFVLNEQGTMQNYIINCILQIAFYANDLSKEKYLIKKRSIEQSNDMSTQEKLDAWDNNYDHWRQEHWLTALCHLAIVAFIARTMKGNPAMMKRIYRSLTAAA